MRKHRRIIIAVAIIAVIIVGIVSVIHEFTSRPSWQLSARNSPQGVIIEVYKSDQLQPTYTTLLPGQAIGGNIDRATRTNLPAQVGSTTFHDETLRPGRWTVQLGPTEIDIMERAMIVNGVTAAVPQKGTGL